MPDYTTTGLLQKIYRRGWMAQAQVATQDDDVLAVATGELRLDLAELLKGARQEYLVFTETVTTTDGTYTVPERALAGTLRSVHRVSGSDLLPLTRLELDNRYGGLPGTVFGYYLEGSKLVFTPAGSNGTFRVSYQLSPAELTTAFMRITAKGATTLSGTVPSAWTGAITVDIQSGKPGFDPRALSLAATVTNSTTLTFGSGVIPAAVVVGDYVALTGTCAIPECPVELHEYLALRACAVLQATTNGPNAANLKALADEGRTKISNLLTPRTGDARIVVPRYGPGRRVW